MEFVFLKFSSVLPWKIRLNSIIVPHYWTWPLSHNKNCGRNLKSFTYQVYPTYMEIWKGYIMPCWAGQYWILHCTICLLMCNYNDITLLDFWAEVENSALKWRSVILHSIPPLMVNPKSQLFVRTIMSQLNSIGWIQHSVLYYRCSHAFLQTTYT